MRYKPSSPLRTGGEQGGYAVPVCERPAPPGQTGCHAPPQVGVVQATGEVSADGEPVLADAGGPGG